MPCGAEADRERPRPEALRERVTDPAHVALRGRYVCEVLPPLVLARDGRLRPRVDEEAKGSPRRSGRTASTPAASTAPSRKSPRSASRRRGNPVPRCVMITLTSS